MGREIVSESWFSNMWRHSWKGAPEADREVIGVLAFEVASLMSKVTNLWHCLSDTEISRLKEEIVSSVGVQKLVSDDDDYLMDLAFNEMLDNFILIARSVARLGRKCTDPHFCHFEHFVNDPIQNNLDWFGWEYRSKKMERKVEKMNRFVAVTLQLSQEVEVLAELEQTLQRMQANANLKRAKLLDFQQKVIWQRQEVRSLREMSPWIRTYDYIVRLLVRSLLTILERIKHIFETNKMQFPEGNTAHEHITADCLPRARSFSAFMHSPIHPSDNVMCGLPSGPLGRSGSKSGQTTEKNKTNTKQRQLQLQSSALHGKYPHLKAKRLAHVGPFKECMMIGSDSPMLHSCKPATGGSMRFTGDYLKMVDKLEHSSVGSLSCGNRIYAKLALLNSKPGMLSAPSSTLGNAALALHYANVIVLIEKLSSSPHMIDFDTRDDLYKMLPTTIRASLRARLKAYATSRAPSLHDGSLATEGTIVLARILEWLSPLAHNMIRWHSEKNIERKQEFSGPNVFLVQTLHFANQKKTEAAITELLVGLNYICRVNRVLKDRASPEFSGDGDYYGYMPKRAEPCP